MKRKRNKFKTIGSKFGDKSHGFVKDSTNTEVSKGLKPRKKKNYSLSDIKNRLSGSRFRFLNEQLYSNKSEDSWKMFNNKPELYEVYHEGYRNQVSNWPYNPVLKVISWLKSNKSYKNIGDFGCGDALIAKNLNDRKVYSFDLVSTNEFVTSCNIMNVPLDDNVLDIVVFCLSLMGTDWPLFVLEATRCLKTGGVLKIVEVTSRFTDVKLFLEFVKSYGYEVNEFNYKKEDFFTSFEFVLKNKLKIDKNILMNKNKLLEPCLYKHR